MSDRKDLSRRKLLFTEPLASPGWPARARWWRPAGATSTTTDLQVRPRFAGGAAAGSAGPAAGSAGPNFAGVKPASKITFWSSNPGSSQQVTQQIIDAFTAQTKISVELVTAGATYADIAQKFQTALAGGGVPDVIVLSDVWWFRYYLQTTSFR